jgi:hypothetical protein
LAGRSEAGERELSKLKEIASSRYVDHADIGIAEFGLGHEDEAFKHLEQAYQEHSNWLLYFKAFPAFDRLRTDPRFVRILMKMGFDQKGHPAS